MKLSYYIVPILLFMTTNCRKDDFITIDTVSDYSDWTETTHGDQVDPDYSIVFNQNEVLRFDIEISSENWSAMQSDLQENISSGGRPGGPGDLNSTDFDPIWVPCSFKFKDREWYNVGIRYKGNSSLRSTYTMGVKKFSFKLDFDEFEDKTSEYANQRFYGFKQLNLNNNYQDLSLMREKIGADLFREFGLASAYSSFCVVYLDYGNGPQYFGVYALVEEVDDTVLDSQFAEGSGNLYKPDGDAASFAKGTYDEDEMEKKNNEDLADYTDVKSLYDLINSSERTNDPEQWKTNLSGIFNVDGYMKWLAANIVIQNWDTYGRMTHNYFLYNNPANNLLTWIPWDNNEAFQEGKLAGALDITLVEVNSYWPLIRYLIDVDEYKDLYDNYLNQFITEVFIPDNMITLYEKYYLMLRDYAYAEESGYTFIRYDSQFDQAVETLKTHVQTRNNVVQSYLK
jgi:spore coat protein H